MRIEKPNRIIHTYKQQINGTIKEIMPLYCPVRELDWVESWDPKTVYSQSGLVEKDCIFITTHGDKEVVWIVTDYDVEAGYVAMFYHIPEIVITKLEIQLSQENPHTTKALLTYSKTSLGVEGNKILETFTQEAYDLMMQSWEKAMNHYLAKGEILRGLPDF